MKTLFIGIDISKDTLDFAICKDASNPIEEGFKVANSIKGISQLINKCKKTKLPLWFCFEHTGNYGLLLSHQLQAEGLTYSIVPALEIKQSQGMVRGKSDLIDARRIALYAAIHKHKLTPCQLPGENLLKIKHLLAYRLQLIKVSQQFQNSRKSYRVSHQSIDMSAILKDLEENINLIKLKIEKVEADITSLINSDAQMAKNFLKSCSVKGIGAIIAAYMLVHTNNFTSFENPRKFNCYAGLAPFEHTSGTSIVKRTKTSSLRNKTMKTLLYNGANSAAIHDKELKAYYKRKINEGKAHQLIMNNIACKLVYRIFAVVNREEPFVNLVR